MRFRIKEGTILRRSSTYAPTLLQYNWYLWSLVWLQVPQAICKNGKVNPVAPPRPNRTAFSRAKFDLALKSWHWAHFWESGPFYSWFISIFHFWPKNANKNFFRLRVKSERKTDTWCSNGLVMNYSLTKFQPPSPRGHGTMTPQSLKTKPFLRVKNYVFRQYLKNEKPDMVEHGTVRKGI